MPHTVWRRAVELSNNIIQKGLAFGRDWSGTVLNPERKRAPRSCPAGSMAEVGLWWCGATPPSNETEDLDVQVCEEAITSASKAFFAASSVSYLIVIHRAPLSS
jgi:hypothetical protein